MPSGLNARLQTGLAWFKVVVGWPVAVFHRLTCPVLSPAARVSPSGLNVTLSMVLWPGATARTRRSGCPEAQASAIWARS